MLMHECIFLYKIFTTDYDGLVDVFQILIILCADKNFLFVSKVPLFCFV